MTKEIETPKLLAQHAVDALEDIASHGLDGWAAFFDYLKLSDDYLEVMTKFGEHAEEVAAEFEHEA